MHIFRYIPGQPNGEALEAAVNSLVAPTAPLLRGPDGAGHEPTDLAQVALIQLADGRLAAGVLVVCDPIPIEIPPGPPTPATEQERAWADLGHGLAPEPVEAPAPATHTAIESSTPPAGARTGTVTDKQLKAIFAIGRAACRMTEAEVERECQRLNNCTVGELSKLAASQFIDAIKAGQVGKAA